MLRVVDLPTQMANKSHSTSSGADGVACVAVILPTKGIIPPPPPWGPRDAACNFQKERRDVGRLQQALTPSDFSLTCL